METACQSWAASNRRSEEHTSELQSQSNLVCRLLLEKKKKINNIFYRMVKARTVERLIFICTARSDCNTSYSQRILFVYNLQQQYHYPYSFIQTVHP